MLSVDHRARTALDVDQPVEAVVDRNIGVDEALEHVHHARIRLRGRRIGRGLALVIAPGEIDRHAPAFDRHGGRELHRLVGDTVAVHEHLGAERSVGEFRERRARTTLGVAQQLLEVVSQRRGAVLGDERLDALGAEPVGRRLGPEVSGDLTRAPEVGADQREDVGIDLAALHEAHGRDDEPLLVDLARHADAARRAAAHVDMVGDVGHVTEQHALVEDRRDECDVVQVHAAQIGIVDQDAVTRRQPLGPVGADGARHDVGERAQVRRLGEGLGDRAQLPVEERAREVAPRLDVGGVGRAPQRGAHLLGDGEQRVADDLEADGIDVGGQGALRRSGRWSHGRSHWAAMLLQADASGPSPRVPRPNAEPARSSRPHGRASREGSRGRNRRHSATRACELRCRSIPS